MTTHTKHSRYGENGRGYREGSHPCPTEECDEFLNGVYCNQGNVGPTQTMFMCPKAIGEQVCIGAGKQAMAPGSIHKKLEYFVEDSKGKLKTYISTMGYGYGYAPIGNGPTWKGGLR